MHSTVQLRCQVRIDACQKSRTLPRFELMEQPTPQPSLLHYSKEQKKHSQAHVAVPATPM